MALTEANNIAIAEIAIYTPSLFIAIFLSIRHGFGRSAGWLYLIIFSLARILGGSLQLATISQPRNLSLYIGAATLNNVALGPLILVQLGLLSRALTSIRKSGETFLNERILRVIQLLVLVGLILASVGGSQSGTDYAHTGVYSVTTLTKAGMGCLIAGFALCVLTAVQVALRISHAEHGERRLALAVGLSLPFVLVRLAYSAATTFGHNPDFNLLTGNANVQLGMAVIMEMFAIAIIEGLGLTLKKVPKDQVVSGSGAQQKVSASEQFEMGPQREAARYGARA